MAYDVGGQLRHQEYGVVDRRVVGAVAPVGQVVPHPVPGEADGGRVPGKPEGIASQHVCSEDHRRGRQIQLRLHRRNTPVLSLRYWLPPTSSLLRT